LTRGAVSDAGETRGFFVTLEGGEGAGKSTQALLLKEWLEASGRRTLVTREPGGSAQGEALRSLLITGAAERWDPISETLLHFAARREHLRATIRPALAQGRWVVCDRFADSTMAYQHFGQGVAADFIEGLYDTVVGSEGPALTLVLDLDPELGFARIAARTGDGGRYEEMDRAFHRRVHEGFRTIAEGAPERCIVISADADVWTVQARLRAAIEARLGPIANG
jgi:dTMP kinase